MEGQDRFIMRELDDAEVGLGEDCEEMLADVGNNADLYAANQESTDLINEAQMEDVPLPWCHSFLDMLLIYGYVTHLWILNSSVGQICQSIILIHYI